MRTSARHDTTLAHLVSYSYTWGEYYLRARRVELYRSGVISPLGVYSFEGTMRHKEKQLAGSCPSKDSRGSLHLHLHHPPSHAYIHTYVRYLPTKEKKNKVRYDTYFLHHVSLRSGFSTLKKIKISSLVVMLTLKKNSFCCCTAVH